MGSFRIFFKRSAEKELRRLPKRDLSRVVAKIKSLAADPRPSGCEKLSGEEKYRLRQGPWRVVYAIDDAAGTVSVYKIGHRREVHR